MVSLGYAQPPNDICYNPEDISDGLWHPGTNQNATLTCSDLRTGQCGAAQQGTNKCCGISGVEGTVWYKFTNIDVGSITVEFRSITCSPVSFLGATSSLQGFVINTLNCGDNSQDLISACFDPATAAPFSVSYSGLAQDYYVQIDTDKNTFTTCTCDNPSSATCHSYCSFEIRVILPTPTPIKFFDGIVKNNYVHLNWLYDWKDNYTHFDIVRKDMNGKDSVLIASKPIQEYLSEDGLFYYDDYSIERNDYYTYSLYASTNKISQKLVGSKIVVVDFAKEAYFNLIPNPARDKISLVLTNALSTGYPYSIINSMGQLVTQGYSSSIPNEDIILDISNFPAGFYLMTIALEDRILQKHFVKQ